MMKAECKTRNPRPRCKDASGIAGQALVKGEGLRLGLDCKIRQRRGPESGRDTTGLPSYAHDGTRTSKRGHLLDATGFNAILDLAAFLRYGRQLLGSTPIE